MVARRPDDGGGALEASQRNVVSRVEEAVNLGATGL